MPHFFLFLLERPLEEYEQVRYLQCMQNSARLKELGLAMPTFYPNNTGRTKTKPHRQSNEDSGSEYDPSHDDDCEENFIVDDNAKVLILQSFKA
jgi:hypothetical protein